MGLDDQHHHLLTHAQVILVVLVAQVHRDCDNSLRRALLRTANQAWLRRRFYTALGREALFIPRRLFLTKANEADG